MVHHQNTFPIPDAPTRFEPVVVTPARLDQFHEAAQLALAETIQEFVRLDGKSVDAARWRFLRSRDGVSVYGDRHPTARHSPLLVAGTIRARLDDVMDGLTMENSDDTRSVLHLLSPRFLDAEVLKVIEYASPENPFAFTGLKWSMVKSSSGVVSKRDICYFEKRGTIDVSSNRKLGYFIMQSVNLPECPPPTSRKIVRADISLCYLFEELADGVVGVYMRGNLMNHGPRMLWKLARNSFAAIVLSMGRAADVVQTKRYTALVKTKLQTRLRAKTVAIACEVCRSLPFLFDHHYACAGCNKSSVCKKCRTKCEVFDLDHDATRTVTATFCVECVERVRSPPRPTKTVSPPPQVTKHVLYDVDLRSEQDDYGQHKQSLEARFTDCEYDAYRNSILTAAKDENAEARRSLQEFSLKLEQQLEDVGFAKSNSGLRLSDLELLGSGHNPFQTNPEDDNLDELFPDSQRSLREFETRLMQQLEDSGYNDADPTLRLSDLESLGLGDRETYGGVATYGNDKYDADSISTTRTVSVGEDEPTWEDEDEEILSIRPLRRSTQPPEMLEMQTLNMDGSIRRRHALSDPETPSKNDHERAMLSRLVEASIAAEQTLQITKEQSRRANHIFAASRSRSLDKREKAEVLPVRGGFLDMLD